MEELYYCQLKVRNNIRLQNLTNTTEIQNEHANHDPFKISLCEGTTGVQRGQFLILLRQC